MTWASPWIIAIAAAIIGILSGMGLGSAGLFVLYLTSLAGMGQTDAQGLNLVFYLCSAGAALCFHATKQTVSPRIIRFLVSFAVMGVIPGVFLADYLDAHLLRQLFGGMLILTGGYSWFRKDTPRRHGSVADKK